MQITQAEFMRKFNETHREEFNPELFKRENQSIIDAIYNVVKSCERDKYFTLKLMSFEVIEDYEEIYNKLRDHEQRRKKKNDKNENFYDYININDSDIMLIKIEWLVRHNGLERQEIDNKTIEVSNPEEVMEVLLAVPRFVRSYYFRLSGNYYTACYQIVDGSTYNNSTASQSKVDTVSLKLTFSPVRLFRGFRPMVDIISGEAISVIEYNSIIFNITCNALYYILANFGMYGTQEFLQIRCIDISDTPTTDPNYLCFEKNGIYVSCPRQCFVDPVVQSFVATIVAGIMKDTTITNLYDQRYWLRLLGIAFKNASIDKGLFVLDSIDGIYDLTTKRDLHLPEEDKADIYTAIRWVIREFSALRIKENVDVKTKRIRIADYIAQVYGTRLNRGLHGLSDLGKRVTLKKVKQRVYTAPLFLLNAISGLSNLVEYRDMVNDLDTTVALKYTYKGISGLGEDGSSIQPVYRYIDPSHIGILDLDASSNSDPGMSGMICPMAKLYDHSFSEYVEPNSWKENYLPLEKDLKKGAKAPIVFDQAPAPFPYYSFRDKIVDEEMEYNKIICPIVDTIDPEGTVYTCSQQIINKNREEQVGKSLFTIVDDDEDDDDFFDEE